MASDKLKLIQDTPSRYHFKTKDDQRVNIEHKNRQLVLRLYKWGEEASLQIDLNVVLADTHQFLENKVEIDAPAAKLEAYPIDARSTAEFYGDSDDDIQCQDGGLRFELVLKAKPLSNSFSIPIKSKNLRFSYQPFLTEQDVAEGRSCPLNVEGSYAVYHTTKKNNQYMTGKAFHIYRPIAEDAFGNKVWCALHIDGHLDPTSLTITVPQQFLDEATYPVVIDPDFGYTTIGGTNYPIAIDSATPYRKGSAWAMPAPGGTANYIRAYIGASAGTPTVDCKTIINQQNSGGVGTHGQIAGPVENLECAAAFHWEEFTFSDEVLTEAVVYILNIIGNEADTAKGETYAVKGDTDGAVNSYTTTLAPGDYVAPASPWNEGASPTTHDYSIYCNYSVPAAVGLENKSANMGAKMVAAGIL
ncbi:hypothetical protein ES703_59390 [subsurface metagenome]